MIFNKLFCRHSWTVITDKLLEHPISDYLKNDPDRQFEMSGMDMMPKHSVIMACTKCGLVKDILH